tara:strand:- start:4088 stop:5035 length:948 start_codon:yes stop_codon:yes gene_type:complete
LENLSFRTPIKTNTEKNTIDYSSKIILFGSCFSENIGNKFRYFKFDALTNPYGILFNPIAIENAIRECVAQKEYSKEDLFFYNEQWHSYKHHSDFSNPDYTLVLKNINNRIQETHQQLKSATHLILTLGTAWVYEHLKNKQVVANCHKVPQNEFQKKILTMEEVTGSLQRIKKQIQAINPTTTIVLTVSPVRHLKDGMIENSLSKAHLLSGIHQVTDKETSYFPSHEILLDDLRDYRFYEKDMVHPNEVAIDYIWNVFKNTWISKKTEILQKKIDSIQKALLHKPFNPASEAHKLFKEKLVKKIKSLNESFSISF